MKKIHLLKINTEEVIVQEQLDHIRIFQSRNDLIQNDGLILPMNTIVEDVKIQKFIYKNKEYYFSVPRDVEFIVNYQLKEKLKSIIEERDTYSKILNDAEKTVDQFWNYPVWKRIYLAIIKSF